MPEYSFFAPDIWSDVQYSHYENTFASTDAMGDPTVEALFFAGYIDRELNTPERSSARTALDDYLSTTYDLEVDEIFDWDAWREAYGTGEI